MGFYGGRPFFVKRITFENLSENLAKFLKGHFGNLVGMHFEMYKMLGGVFSSVQSGSAFACLCPESAPPPIHGSRAPLLWA